MIIPIITDFTRRGNSSADLFSHLLKNRIIFLTGHIETDMANIVVASLLFLESQDAERDVLVYINSPGGSIVDGNSILNTMKLIKCDISTIVIGQAASMASVILSAGTKGKRFMLPLSEVMIHQPKGGSWGQSTDIDIQANRLAEYKRSLTQMLADNCGKPFYTLHKDMERDYFMSAQEAVEYGIADGVLWGGLDSNQRKRINIAYGSTD